MNSVKTGKIISMPFRHPYFKPAISLLKKWIFYAEEFDPGNKIHRRLRMYVGLEEPEYLIEDLGRGFENAYV